MQSPFHINQLQQYETFFYNELLNYKELVNYEEKVIYEFLKRVIEIIICLIILVPVTLVITVISLLIILDSPGNPIFSQVRVGYKGKLIKVHKLRSMYKDAEARGQKWAEKNDPRITKIGLFIRKTRLDELPQVYDVLLGNMSLIGPRPEVPVLTEKFHLENPGFVTRLIIRPGLTGYAQINGGYDLTPEQKWIKDNYYIENRSFTLDMNIILKTIMTVFTGDGAR